MNTFFQINLNIKYFNINQINHHIFPLFKICDYIISLATSYNYPLHTEMSIYALIEKKLRNNLAFYQQMHTEKKKPKCRKFLNQISTHISER